MSWKSVTISHGKTSKAGMMRGDEIVVGSDLSNAKTLKVDGKSFTVESCALDDRKENWVLKLLNGSIKEKSNDEPDEGGDADNTGEE